MTKLALIIAIIVFLISCNSSKNFSDTNISKIDNKDVLHLPFKINTQSRDAQLIELGIDFVAFGNKPSWILKIDFDKRTAQFEQFEGINAKFKLTNNADNNIEAVEYLSKDATLYTKIEENNCYNIITGEGFTFQVKLEINGEQLEGFGKYLAEETPTPSINPIIFGNWNLTKLANTSLKEISGASITFLANNTLNGNNGCNNYFGTYDLYLNKINLINMGSTKMYCKNNIEREFALAQQRVTNYIIKNNILMLYNNDNKLEMQFAKSTE